MDEETKQEDIETKDKNMGMMGLPMGVNFARTFEDLDAYEDLMERKGQVIKRADQLKMMAENAEDDSMLKTVIKGCMDKLKGMYSNYDGRYGEMDKEAEAENKAVTKKEDGVDYPASDFAYVPDPDTPSTWKLRLAENEPGNITVAQLGRAAAAFSPGGFRGNKVQIPAADVAKVKRRIRTEYKKLDVPEGDMPASVKEIVNGFTLWKEENGRYRWLAIYSNKFRDDDNPPEILSEKSHLKFVDMIDKGQVPYPELWLWHIPGTRWGQADYVAYDDNGFAISSGLIDQGKEKIAEGLMKQGDILVSHGMPINYIKREDDDPTVITEYITSEISPLPAKAAANKLTGFSILSEDKGMSLSQEKKQFLTELGVDIDELEKELQGKAQSAIAQGVEFKEEKQEKQPEEEMADKPKEAQQPTVDYVSRSELTEVLSEIGNSIKALTQQVETLTQSSKAKGTDNTTPAASSLMDIWKNASAIGAKETELDGRTKEAQAEPELPPELQNKNNKGWSAEGVFSKLIQQNQQFTNGAKV